MKQSLKCIEIILVAFLPLFCTGAIYGQFQLEDFPVLPVELVYFRATSVDTAVLLEFGTATEVDNYGFSIERTYDSTNISQWISIGFVDGHGNSNSPKDYTFLDESIYQNGIYYYRLKQIDNDGSYNYIDTTSVLVDFVTSIGENESHTFISVLLSQNYPNPFNPNTIISYSIPELQEIKIAVYDLLGKEVEVLYEGYQYKGLHNILFEPSEKLISGVYIYTLHSKKYSISKKLILIR
jgi:hypothetical protein